MPGPAEQRLHAIEEALGIKRPEGRLFRRDNGPTPLLQAWCDRHGQDASWVACGDPYFWIRRSTREIEARRKRTA